MVARYARFTLPADPLAVRDARLRVAELEGLPERVLAEAQLLLSELVTNSILHAGLKPAEAIQVVLRREDGRLAIEVDDGDGFFGRTGQSRRRRRVGGQGLKVLDAVCEWCTPKRAACRRRSGSSGAADYGFRCCAAVRVSALDDGELVAHPGEIDQVCGGRTEDEA